MTLPDTNLCCDDLIYKAGQVWQRVEGIPGNQKRFTIQVLVIFYDLHGKPKLVIQRHTQNIKFGVKMVSGRRYPSKLVSPCYMCGFTQVKKPILVREK